METRPTCNFCGKVFTSSYVLNKHKKTAIFCLKIQQEIKKSESRITSITGIQEILEEERRQTKRLEEVIEEQKELNGKLQKRFEQTEESLLLSRKEIEFLTKEADNLRGMVNKSLERPATVNAHTTNKITNGIENFVNMMPPITQNHLEAQAQYLQKEHIQQGMDGYARYALDYPFKDRVVCSDFSRRKVQYKDGDGKIVNDPEMIKLSQELFKAIRTRNDELIKEYTNDLLERIKEDDSPVLTEILTEMCTLQREVRKLARGQKSEMTPTFVKTVCAKTSKSEGK